MLDIKYIREHADEIKKAVKLKKIDLNIDDLLKLDRERRGAVIKIDELRAKRNKLPKPTTNELNSMCAGGQAPKVVREGKKIKTALLELENSLEKIDLNYNSLLIKVPNLISSDTPIGSDESGNKVLRKFSEPPQFTFKPRDHMELGEMHGIIDTEKSAKISGARFNYLFGEAVLLQFSLLQFIFATLTNPEIIKELADKVGNPFSKPFTPVITPDMVKSKIMKKMDRFDPIEDRYYLKDDDILLIGSAEHSLGPIHMDETLNEKDLPIRYIGYSTAFRREAGTYGKDTAGILRRHQFDKAEMETFTQPEHGLVEQDLIIALQEYMVQKLKIPYQVVAICAGDMGKPDFRQIDIECWMPAQGKYRETHTSDYMTDFQSRRLNIKYKTKDGKKKLVHMNDATAFAIGRTLVAILENYQQEDGSIIIPEVLRKYMPGNIEKIELKK